MCVCFFFFFPFREYDGEQGEEMLRWVSEKAKRGEGQTRIAVMSGRQNRRSYRWSEDEEVEKEKEK